MMTIERHKTSTLMILLFWLSGAMTMGHAQSSASENYTSQDSIMSNTSSPKMVVEVWSDITCPFCYMGKRKFEMALSQFPDSNKVQIVWKSFQLNPDAVTDTSISVFDELVRTKGWSMDQVKQITSQVTASAAQVGLTYNFDRVVVVNTMNAHQLLHLAKRQGLQNQVKEALFSAYFTDGKNVDDIGTLEAIALSCGMNTQGMREALANGELEDEVKMDIHESRQLGVRGVPFFVFDRKYAVSGAQEPSAFSQVLEQSFSEWKKANNGNIEVLEGQQCTPSGKCE